MENMSKWNRCDICGEFIPFCDFVDETAVRRLVLPDSEYSVETFETLCWKHNKNERTENTGDVYSGQAELSGS